MTLRQTPDEYLYHLEVTNPSDAKRLWKERIKDNWNWQCAYCGDDDNLTLDHVKPRSLGGEDVSRNVVCACKSCNQSKGREYWRDRYYDQDFFSWERQYSIEAWIQEPKRLGRYRAYTRKNICYTNVA